MTALHHAAELGFDQIAIVLLSHSADPTLKVRNQTPMDMAVANGHKRVVELLEAAGDIAARRGEQNVPLAQLSAEQVAAFLSVKHLSM
jgi:ankyrin repeat protein